ncbi:hypothetical protein B0H13DRAFT_871511 [Mycena leptocephala]|nr:hypothetical protein B0H13DRAFT_871511 [Mycena leptocephala]
MSKRRGERGGRLAIFHIRLILPESQSSQSAAVGGCSGRQRKIDTGGGRGAHRGASRRAGCCDTARWIMASGVNGLGVYPAILEEVVRAQQQPGPCIAPARRFAPRSPPTDAQLPTSAPPRRRPYEGSGMSGRGTPALASCRSSRAQERKFGRILQGACLAQHTSWRHCVFWPHSTA